MNETTYHVARLMVVGSEQTHQTEHYLRPDGRWTLNEQDAMIYSRSGAIHHARNLGVIEGWATYPVMLTTTGQVRKVHATEVQS